MNLHESLYCNNRDYPLLLSRILNCAFSFLSEVQTIVVECLAWLNVDDDDDDIVALCLVKGADNDMIDKSKIARYSSKIKLMH